MLTCVMPYPPLSSSRVTKVRDLPSCPVLLSGRSTVLCPAPTPSGLPRTSAIALYPDALPPCTTPRTGPGGPPQFIAGPCPHATSHTPERFRLRRQFLIRTVAF